MEGKLRKSRSTKCRSKNAKFSMQGNCEQAYDGKADFTIDKIHDDRYVKGTKWLEGFEEPFWNIALSFESTGKQLKKPDVVVLARQGMELSDKEVRKKKLYTGGPRSQQIHKCSVDENGNRKLFHRRSQKDWSFPINFGEYDK
ncbi:unnamed protein product [Caenorhabditis nigoni]